MTFSDINAASDRKKTDIITQCYLFKDAIAADRFFFF